MASRFVARRNNGKYCLWDHKTDAVALKADSQTRYENLEFSQAIDAAIELNRPTMTIPPAMEAPQQAAQQQQQPQPKGDKKD